MNRSDSRKRASGMVAAQAGALRPPDGQPAERVGLAGTFTAERLFALCPKARPDIVEALLTGVDEFAGAQVATPVQLCHFLAQIAAESSGLTTLEENLGYTTAARLMAAWPGKFDSPDAAKPYLRSPERLADFVYGRNKGNRGGTDGWDYRGSGVIRVTGRAGFREVGDACGLPLEDEPDLARHADGALAVALSYWKLRDVGGRANGTSEADVKAVTQLTNESLAGFDRRLRYFRSALKIFARGPDPVRADSGAFPISFRADGPELSIKASGSAPADAAPAGPADKLSGPQWVPYFPTSTNVSDLSEPFASNVVRFLDALGKAGARVRISATYRPPERAYLMHWAWVIAKRLDPRTAPPMKGVDIVWVHPSAAQSRAAAKAMVDAYGMAHVAALNSRHTEGRAIDMTISWNGDLKIARPTGGQTTVGGQPRNGSNPGLVKVGAEYGVVKLPTDPPHWSDDGR